MKKRKIIWMSLHCLLDTTSGASLAVLNILKILKKTGWDVECIGCTTFDSPSAIDEEIKSSLNKIPTNSFFEINDSGNIKHTLLKTNYFESTRIFSEEIDRIFHLYISKLKTIKPDLVFYYGGSASDLLIPLEAKRHNIASAIYVGNSKYIDNPRWAEDVSLILTDTNASAELYKKSLNLDLKVAGSMIERESVVATQKLRKRVLFVNPESSKGAYLVAQVVIYMSIYRPDIIFEVVESRGRWQQALDKVFHILKISSFELKNVQVTKNQTDMRPIYGRARLLLHPSLAWESGGRVIAEAAMNGIPAMITPIGGQREVMGDGGIVLDLDKINYKHPYENLLSQALLEKWVEKIKNWFDDDTAYEFYSDKSLKSSINLHNIEINTKNINDFFEKTLNK